MEMHGKNMILLVALLTIITTVPELAKVSPDINCLEDSYVLTTRSPNETFTETSLSENIDGVTSMLKIADDTFYLRINYSLTTEKPQTGTPDILEVPTGQTLRLKWVNGTVVPSGCEWYIPSGNYIFYVWMDRTGGKPENVTVVVTFTFGYIKEDGTEVEIMTGTSGQIFLDTDPELYSIMGSGGSASIPSGSRLFLSVTISATGTVGEKARFIYDSKKRDTRIVTPPISSQVPELPLGVFFLLPILLLAYFIFKKRFEKR